MLARAGEGAREHAGMTDTLVFDAANRLFADLVTPELINATEAGTWPDTLWRAIVESGFLDVLAATEPFSLAAVPDAVAVFRAAGRHAVPAPLVETALARWVAAGLGLSVGEGPLALELLESGEALSPSNLRTAANLSLVPSWAGGAILVGDRQIGIVESTTPRMTPARSPEPRDALALDLAGGSIMELSTGIDRDLVFRLGALARAAQMVGAMETALDLARDYAGTRVQFGRPLAKLQVIQHQLALAAEQVAAAGTAVEAAAASVARDAAASLFPIAAAKIRAGEAAGKVAEIVHQVHGAIGFTQEHRLHHFTRRLWSWRDEFGTESDWSLALGRALGKQGADALWPTIVEA
jgi:acyl-CoA dehydrogenase